MIWPSMSVASVSDAIDVLSCLPVADNRDGLRLLLLVRDNGCSSSSS
jgi:hypothetical protein